MEFAPITRPAHLICTMGRSARKTANGDLAPQCILDSEPTLGPVDTYSGGVLGKEEEDAQNIQTN
jgi:hypothetical protein